MAELCIDSKCNYTNRDYDASVERERKLRNSAATHEIESWEHGKSAFRALSKRDPLETTENIVKSNRHAFEATKRRWEADREMNERKKKSEE